MKSVNRHWARRQAGGHYNYFRDYDPGIGRYVESDLAGMGGGPNTYGYVGASPLRRIDKLGLIGHDPPEPESADAGWPICNGRGGIEIQYPILDEQTKKCIGDCLREHETVHIVDLRKAGPTVCKGYPRRWIPRFDTDGEARASERRAYDAEIRCLVAKLKGLSDCDVCKPIVENRLNNAKGWRETF